MSLIKTNWDHELEQVKVAAGEIVETQIAPMMQSAIRQAGDALNEVVERAGLRIEDNIRVLSEEIHSHRTLTREDMAWVIDHASNQLAQTIDERMARLRMEATEFVNERVEQLKGELDEAAVRSKRTAFTNVAISVCGATAMGVVAFVYKRISLGELDPLDVFRVILLALATGSLLLSALKLLGQWRNLRGVRRNIATVVINQLSLLRPNGAIESLVIALICVGFWYLATFHLGR